VYTFSQVLVPSFDVEYEGKHYESVPNWQHIGFIFRVIRLSITIPIDIIHFLAVYCLGKCLLGRTTTCLKDLTDMGLKHDSKSEEFLYASEDTVTPLPSSPLPAILPCFENTSSQDLAAKQEMEDSWETYQRMFPSFLKLVETVDVDLKNNKEDFPNRYLCLSCTHSILCWIPPAQLLSSRGRSFWLTVIKNYITYGWVSFGFWSVRIYSITDYLVYF
jgi:hypothetical protein